MRGRLNTKSSQKVAAKALSGVVAAAGVLALAAASASAAPYLSLDFESPNVAGSAPTSPAPAATSGLPSSVPAGNGKLMVVDHTTTPVDPFAPSGNQSLWMQTAAAASSTSARATFSGTGTGLTSGTFSGQFVIPSGSYGEVRVGTGDTFSSGIGPFIGFSGNGHLSAVGTGNGTLDQVASAGTVHTLVINFDTATQKYSGSLDNIPLTKGAQTQFNFYQSVAAVKSIGLTVGFSSTSQQVFFDNLSLKAVPEPTTLGLMSLGAMGVLARRRHK